MKKRKSWRKGCVGVECCITLCWFSESAAYARSYEIRKVIGKNCENDGFFPRKSCQFSVRKVLQMREEGILETSITLCSQYMLCRFRRYTELEKRQR